MKTTKFNYYDNFKCIADRCKDSCCIGWEIDIDPDTVALYERDRDILGELLEGKIAQGSFVLDGDERCPLLRTDGLCEMICRHGEGYLCEICREHPRYYEIHGDYCDMGVGLCCEEACRLLFDPGTPIILTDEGEAEPDTDIEELRRMRSTLIDALTKDKEAVTELIYPVDNGIFRVWDHLEPFDGRWTETVSGIKENFDFLLTLTDGFDAYMGNRREEYVRLAIYLLHRYFMRGLYADPTTILEGISLYLKTQYLWDVYTYHITGKFDDHDRIDTAKYISKQIEYSEENIDFLLYGEV